MSARKPTGSTTSDKPKILLWPSSFCARDEIHIVCHEANLKAVISSTKGLGQRVIKHEAMNQPIAVVFRRIDTDEGVEV